MTRTAEQEGDVYLSFFLTCSFPHSVSSAADILPLGRPLQPLTANRKWLCVQWWELPVTTGLFATTPMTNNGLSDTAPVFINAGKHHCCCYCSYFDMRHSNKPQALGVVCWGKVWCYFSKWSEFRFLASECESLVEVYSFLVYWLIYLQVTFIYIVLYTIQTVLKQLCFNKTLK